MDYKDILNNTDLSIFTDKNTKLIKNRLEVEITLQEFAQDSEYSRAVHEKKMSELSESSAIVLSDNSQSKSKPKIDFSQYMKKPVSEPKPQESKPTPMIDFSQYMKKPVPEPKPQESKPTPMIDFSQYMKKPVPEPKITEFIEEKSILDNPENYEGSETHKIYEEFKIHDELVSYEPKIHDELVSYEPKTQESWVPEPKIEGPWKQLILCSRCGGECYRSERVCLNCLQTFQGWVYSKKKQRYVSPTHASANCKCKFGNCENDGVFFDFGVGHYCFHHHELHVVKNIKFQN